MQRKDLGMQEVTQVRTVPIHGIANHPTNRQRGADRLVEAGSRPTPVSFENGVVRGYERLACEQDHRTTLLGCTRPHPSAHVPEPSRRSARPNLTILHPSGRTAILGLHPCRIDAPFGHTRLIKNHHRKGRLNPLSRVTGDAQRWHERKNRRLHQQRADLIANAFIIPDGLREQTLHAIGASLLRVFGDLPTVFPGDLADHRLQREQSMVRGFGASKIGSKALMQGE